MDELVEDYDDNRALIEVLGVSIERWEESSSEFAIFNESVKKLNSAEASLRVLMEQHQLGVADLPEIGSKSLVSRILNGERQLTKRHIEALCKRFKVSPELFLIE